MSMLFPQCLEESAGTQKGKSGSDIHRDQILGPRRTWCSRLHNSDGRHFTWTMSISDSSASPTSHNTCILSISTPGRRRQMGNPLTPKEVYRGHLNFISRSKTYSHYLLSANFQRFLATPTAHRSSRARDQTLAAASSNLSCCSDNAGPYTCCATMELRESFKFFFLSF